MKCYFKVKEAAMYMSVSESFLKNNMNNLFFEETHFYKPKGARMVRWYKDALDDWMQGNCAESITDENNHILNQLIK